MLTRAVVRSGITAATLLTVSLASATNGYTPTGFGTTNKGLAGAGVAFPQDAMTAATNPAGLVHLGNRIDAGAALFAPDRGFTADANGGAPFPTIPAGNYESDNDFFLIPHFGWNHRLDEDSSIGVLLGGNGGMNTEYDSAVWQNFTPPLAPPQFDATEPTGVDFAQLFVGVTYAFKVNERHSFGVMPIVAVQRVEVEGLEPFRLLSIDRDNVTNNGHDYSWGYGIRVGWLGQLTDRLAIGASAQSRLYMTEFDDYAGLFAEKGDFDVPPTVTVGMRFDVSPEVTLVADWQRTFYGEIDALSNPNDTPISGSNLLGSDDGLGFGWDDIDIFKLGVQWQYNPKLVLRAGVSHADQLFNNGESLFNILAPATVRTHASLGMSYRLESGSTISAAYTHAFEEKIKGRNPNFTGQQTGDVRMDQHELELSWAWNLD